MLKRRAVHKDMAEANVYAARRLKDMAQSLGGLAKTFGRCREEPGLSREDGIAALEAASAMVCGACESCGIQRECRRGGDDENYYLYYLLRTFEKKGCVEYEDMPRRFLEVCRRKSDYLGQLNRNLGRPWYAERASPAGSSGNAGGAGMMRIIICIIFCGPLKKRAVWNMRTCPGGFWRYAGENRIIWGS